MEENTQNKNPDCPCKYRDCPRNRDCEKCQEFHHANGSKTTCGK